MKKVLTLILTCSISATVFASCIPFNKHCPVVNCPDRTFMGDDGKCYDCQEKADIEVDCIGKEKALQICPNRFYTSACGYSSVLTCYGLDPTFYRFKRMLSQFFDPFNWEPDERIYIDDDFGTYIDYREHSCGRLSDYY